MVWNEVSRRYVTEEPEFYQPDFWRKAADNVKQGSSDEEVNPEYNPLHLQQNLKYEYLRAIKDFDVCPEQARMILPQNTYTEWFWTGNLYSFANVYIQRTDSHAQREVQSVAHQIGDIIEPLFPVSWPALVKGDE
jgi:thymidylate synthase (FAD)